MITEFTPWSSLTGGALIGLAVVLLMALHGRIAGVTGILSGLLAGQFGWRAGFIAGAVLAPLLVTRLFGVEIAFASPLSGAVGWVLLIVSGLMVGIGVSYGGGCTSGHGICGNARFSRRSLVATIAFTLSAGVTVWVIRHLIGGL